MDKTPNIKQSIFNDYFKDRLDEIKKYYEPIDKHDLYIRENPNNVFINFLHYEDPINLFHDINNDHKTLQNMQNINKKYLKIR